MKFLTCLLVLLFCCPCAVAGAADEVIGSVKNVSGQGFIVRAGNNVPATAGAHLYGQDILLTAEDGAIGVILRDDSTLSIGPNSRIELSEFAFDPAAGRMSFITRLTKGTAAYLSGLIAKLSPKSVRFETPLAIVGVRGTRFVVRVEGD